MSRHVMPIKGSLTRMFPAEHHPLRPGIFTVSAVPFILIFITVFKYEKNLSIIPFSRFKRMC